MKDIKAFEPIGGNWYIEGSLGGGAYGKVYAVYSDKTGIREYAAIKHIPIPASEEAYTNLKIALNTTDEQIIGENLDASKAEVLSEYNIQCRYRGLTNFVDCQDIYIMPRESGDLPGYDIFIRMEKLVNLANETIGKRMTPREGAKLGIDVCKALEILHRDRIVHRDLKPQNIFIGKNGDYKVGDFGAARSIQDGSTMMSYTGTAGFMAPEIANGEAAGCDADIYSLGVILYRQLNGSAPFLPAGATSSVAQINQAEFDRLTGKPFPPILGIPDELNRIVLKACAFKRKNRYQQASEMKEELTRFLDGIDDIKKTKADPVSSTVTDTIQNGSAPGANEDSHHEPESYEQHEPDPGHVFQSTENDQVKSETTWIHNKQNINHAGETVHRSIVIHKETTEPVKSETGETKPAGSDATVEITQKNENERPKRKTFLWIVTAAVLLALITAGILYFIPGKGIYNNLQKGDVILFGKYPQTSAGTDMTDIQWRVLKVDSENKKALLISEYALDCMPYNDEKMDTSWENSSLRVWLNEVFATKASFSENEKNAILETEIDNGQSQRPVTWTEDNGRTTNDRFFLLSYREVENTEYFSGFADRKCVPTEYAVTRSALRYAGDESQYMKENSGCCYWWLRTPGQTLSSACCVTHAGTHQQMAVDCGECAVRPAFWLSTDP